ncbi:MAG: DUF4351 domain-containing protein [Methylococcaceae bacterium]|nr:DUF4351 domain-containing protein [Methylococcaceae bacterium]
MIHFPKINIKQTPLYQKAFEIGIYQGKLEIVSIQLSFLLGKLNITQQQQIESLSPESFNALTEELLVFKTVNDLNH